jgi:hypothetical protein
MLAGIGTSVIRAAAVIPAVLLVLFAGLLWLLGLPCGKDRRSYVITLSQQAMDVVGVLLHGSPGTRSQAALAEGVRQDIEAASADHPHDRALAEGSTADQPCQGGAPRTGLPTVTGSAMRRWYR